MVVECVCGVGVGCARINFLSLQQREFMSKFWFAMCSGQDSFGTAQTADEARNPDISWQRLNRPEWLPC